MGEYKAEFLWPAEEGSVEEAGYEFANAKTEAYQRMWWKNLLYRLKQDYWCKKHDRPILILDAFCEQCRDEAKARIDQKKELDR